MMNEVCLEEKRREVLSTSAAHKIHRPRGTKSSGVLHETPEWRFKEHIIGDKIGDNLWVGNFQKLLINVTRNFSQAMYAILLLSLPSLMGSCQQL